MKKFAEVAEEKMITLASLKERGWTTGAVKKFAPEPDTTAVNPTYRSAAPMKLYALKRVEQIEVTPEFRSWKAANANRRQGAAKAVATKKEQMQRYVDSVTIKVPVMTLERLYKLARRHYNKHQEENALERGEFYDARPNATVDPEKERLFQERIAVNYLRHVCTSYDKELERAFGKTGRQIVYEGISNKVFGAIADAYPNLREECARQIQRR